MSDIEALLAEMRDGIDNERGEMMITHNEYNRLVLYIDQRNADIAQLRKALQRYGAHDEDCDLHQCGPELCTCGLDAAMGLQP